MAPNQPGSGLLPGSRVHDLEPPCAMQHSTAQFLLEDGRGPWALPMEYFFKMRFFVPDVFFDAYFRDQFYLNYSNEIS